MSAGISIHWNSLLRFSQSQIVLIGTYAVTIIPIIAQHAALFFSVPSFDFTQILLGEGVFWFAIALYFGGLLVFLGKLLVQLLCPEAIHRYPFEDDYMRFSAKVREAQAYLDENARLELNAPEPDPFKALAHSEENAANHLKAWRSANQSRKIARYLIAFLFFIGATLIVLFLFERLLTNGMKVFGLTGIL